MTDHSSSLVSQRLLFGNGNNLTVSRDPVALANRLAQHYKLLDFGPRPGHERSFIHRSFTAVTGELAVTCGYASPIYGVMGERPDASLRLGEGVIHDVISAPTAVGHQMGSNAVTHCGGDDLGRQVAITWARWA